MGIVREQLADWVPAERAAQFVGKDDQVAEGGGAVADLRMSAGPGAGMDALETVGVMVVSADVDVTCPELETIEEGFRSGFDGSAGGHSGDPAALPDEKTTEETGQAGVCGNGMIKVFDLAPIIDVVEQDAVGVLAGESGELAVSGVKKLDWTARFHAQGILNDVSGVGLEPSGGGSAEILAK